MTQQQGRLAGIAAWHLLLELVHDTDLYGARGTVILFVAACRQISNFVDWIIVSFGVLPYIINLRLSKYFVTFEMTIWRLWELGFSREFPVREDSPSDASGLQPR